MLKFLISCLLFCSSVFAAIGPELAYQIEHGITCGQALMLARSILPLELDRKLFPKRLWVLWPDKDSHLEIPLFKLTEIYESQYQGEDAKEVLWDRWTRVWKRLVWEALNSHEDFLFTDQIFYILNTGTTRGELDESARTLSTPERKSAELLLEEGWHVTSTAEGLVMGQRSADGKARQRKEIFGRQEYYTFESKIEIKTLKKSVTDNTIKNSVMKSLKNEGQAPYILVDARDTDLTPEQAVLAMQQIFGLLKTEPLKSKKYINRINYLRIVGMNFDYTAQFLSEEKKHKMLNRIMHSVELGPDSLRELNEVRADLGEPPVSSRPFADIPLSIIDSQTP